jgi:hypothetical protein
MRGLPRDIHVYIAHAVVVDLSREKFDDALVVGVGAVSVAGTMAK